MPFLTLLTLLSTDLIMVICGSDLVGHLKPLGHHRPPKGDIQEVLSFPDPGHFHENYVRGSTPLLFRGILETDFLPAYKIWTDEFLSEQYGTLLVGVQMQKVDRGERNRQEVFTLSRFLDEYKQDDIHMVDLILLKKLSDDIVVPRSLMCEGMHRIHQVRLSLSGGGTVSKLRSNVLESIKCLLDGELRIIMIDKHHIDLIQTDHWDFENDYHEVDANMVDMVRYPQFQNVTHLEVKMTKGDCLFIPSKWYVQITSTSDMRNMAIDYVFRPTIHKTPCSDVNLDVPLPLNNVKNMTKYIEFVRFWLEIDFFEHKSAHSFETFWRRTEWSSDGAFDRAAAEKLFAYIDLNGNQEITMDELERFDFHKAAREVPAISDFVINMVAAAVAEGIDIDFLDGPTANEHIDKVHEEL